MLNIIKDKGWVRVRIVFDIANGRYVVNFDLNQYNASSKERVTKFLHLMKKELIQSSAYIIQNPDVKVLNECKGNVFEEFHG